MYVLEVTPRPDLVCAKHSLCLGATLPSEPGEFLVPLLFSQNGIEAWKGLDSVYKSCLSLKHL